MAPKTPADELEILAPDRQITLRGEALTVREFYFFEGIELTRIAAPILAEMSALFRSDREVELSDLEDLLIRHTEPMLILMARSIGKPVEWLKSPEVGDAEGHLLLSTFWTVNSHFFVHRLMMSLAARQLSTEGSPASSPH